MPPETVTDAAPFGGTVPQVASVAVRERFIVGEFDVTTKDFSVEQYV